MRNANQKARWTSASALLRYASRKEVQERQSQVRFRLTPENEDVLAAEVALADPRRVAADHANIVAESVIAALWRPQLFGPSTYGLAGEIMSFLLSTRVAPSALGALADVLARPDRPRGVYAVV